MTSWGGFEEFRGDMATLNKKITKKNQNFVKNMTEIRFLPIHHTRFLGFGHIT